MTEITSGTLFYVNVVRITVFCCSHFLFYFEILPLCFSSCFLVPPVCFFPFLPSPLLSPPHLHLFLILSSLYYLTYSSFVLSSSVFFHFFVRVRLYLYSILLHVRFPSTVIPPCVLLQCLLVSPIGMFPNFIP